MTASLAAVLAATLLLLEWPLLPGLFVAVALTATGIGVSVRVWPRPPNFGSAKGALPLDVAELDDLFVPFFFISEGRSEECPHFRRSNRASRGTCLHDSDGALRPEAVGPERGDAKCAFAATVRSSCRESFERAMHLN